jgi:galactokinase
MSNDGVAPLAGQSGEAIAHLPRIPSQFCNRKGLGARGYNAAAVGRFASLEARFRQRFGRLPQVVRRAPGRLNLIGEHIDYTGGLVLPVAIDRYVTVAAARQAGRAAVVYSEAFQETSDFSIGAEPAAPGHWSNYLRGVTALLAQSHPGVGGFQAIVRSNLPAGAGLSSSAALEVATARALMKLFDLEVDPKALAVLCQQAEHRFAGVRCGIMDQMAVVFARAGHALLLDCRRLDFSYIRTAGRGVRLLVCDTGVRRALAASKYNQRRRECERALELLRREGNSDWETLTAVPLTRFRRLAGALPEPLARRARHAITEQARVRRAAWALTRNRFAVLGRLLDRSHQSLARDYEVSSAELDTMVRLARRLPGVYGARLVGAGFGGAALALVQSRQAASFRRRLAAEYRASTGSRPEIHLLRNF